MNYSSLFGTSDIDVDNANITNLTVINANISSLITNNIINTGNMSIGGTLSVTGTTTLHSLFAGFTDLNMLVVHNQTQLASTNISGLIVTTNHTSYD